MYHSIDEQPGILPAALNVTPKVFEEQLKYLTKNYNVVPLSAIVKALRSNKKLPPHSVALTFDDGLKNNLTIAAPLLKKYGCAGTFYIVGQCLEQKKPWIHRWYILNHCVEVKTILAALTEQVNQPIKSIRHGVQVLKYYCSCQQRENIIKSLENKFAISSRSVNQKYLTLKDIHKLKQDGHEIGYHTQSHSPLAGLTPEGSHKEIVSSKQKVEKQIGHLNHFAYPFGESRALGNSLQLLAKHYDSAVTTVEGLISLKDNPYQLRRLSVINGTIPMFAATVEGKRWNRYVQLLLRHRIME